MFKNMGETFKEFRDRFLRENYMSRSPMPECKPPKKVWACSDCGCIDKEVFDVDGLDFCGDCLAERASAFNAMLKDMGEWAIKWRYAR